MTMKAPFWVRAVGWIALLATAAVVLAGPLTRFGVMQFGPALKMLGLAGMIAGAAAVLCLVAWFVMRKRAGAPGTKLALAGLVAGGLAFAFLMMLRAQASSVPPIHDISTDTVDPPQFVAVLPLRADALNPPEYAGPEAAEQQKSAYPDLKPLVMATTPTAAFDKALDAVKSLGWDVVAAVPAEGRIEATDTTTWFGFKDDVVIRIRPSGEGAVVDVRSKSRVGKSDLGANAKRIRTLIDKIRG